LPTAIGFTAFLLFLSSVAKTLNVAEKTEIWNSCEYQFNVKIWKKLEKKFDNKILQI